MANTYFNNISKEKSVYIKYMDLHRRSLITEAYVNYLYTKGEFSMEILYNATDKEVSDMYYKYVSEKNVRKEASDWGDRYCFNNK